MDKKISKLNIWLTYSLCGVLTLQPALANVVIDSASGNTSKTQAGNGVEVVNIATPNSKGLSHNKYQQFNVDPSGLILNNSTEALSRSQLGGILQGNPHLKGKAANIILNEVTGANRSQLEGYTEVFGQQANVILANPYGITCDGCGFINTPRVTLSTGAPELNNGQLAGFDVSEGSVTIEGLGLDATNQTYFDIISRTAEINANIHANDLSVITGTNQVGYQTNHVAEKSSKPTNKPALAIDSSSLGGMYAGRISLVATEDGVGVNVGNLSSSQGNLTLDSDGKIVLGRSSSSRSIKINSKQDVLLTDVHSAGNEISIKADQVIANKAKVVTGQTLSLESSKLDLNNSTLESPQLLTRVQGISVDQPSSISSVTAQFRDLVSIENQGKLSASDSLVIEGNNSALNGTGSIDTSKLKTQTNNLTLDTVVNSESAELNTKHNLSLGTSGKLSATKDIQVETDTLQLNGEINANKAVDVKAEGTVTITGKLNANSASLSAKHLYQHGNVKATNTLNLEASQRFEQSLSGVVEADNGLTIEADNLSLAGQSHSNKSTVIKGSKTMLIGEHQAVHDLIITSNTLEQRSQLSANQNVMLTATGQLTNTGNINAGQALKLTAQNLDNLAQLSAQQDVKLSLSNELLNQSDGLISGQNTILTASNIENTGSLQALEHLGLDANSLTNIGVIVSGADIITQLKNMIINHGVIYTSNNALLYSRQLNNYGSILADGDITIANNVDNDKSLSLVNRSGLIESRNSSINIYTDFLENEADNFVDSVEVTKDERGKYSSIFNSTGTAYEPTYSYRTQRTSSSAGAMKLHYFKLESKPSFSVVVLEEKAASKDLGPSSKIIADKSVSIFAGELHNNSSLIAGNDVLVNADSLHIKTLDGNTYSTVYDYKLKGGFNDRPSYVGPGDALIDYLGVTYVLDRIRKEVTKASSPVSSSIAAVNKVNIDVKNVFDNKLIKPNSALPPKSSQLSPLSLESAPSISRQIISNNTPLPEFQFPTNPNGLFIYSDGPSSRYLIETNPLLSDMEQYLGSDYFQHSVGFNPESEITFLGDAFYDTRIITQAIFEQTGQRYLSAEIGSDLSQMQQLIDAAAEQKFLLNLQAGIALSQEQVDKLTSNIIWYEPIVVKGKEVLAPKLYIANLNQQDFTSGSVIAGNKIEINAGNIVNSGTIKANDTLLLSSEKKIINDTGSLQADGDLIAESQGNIENLSGSITGDNVALVSHDGSVINKTLHESLNADKNGRLVDSFSPNIVLTNTNIADQANIVAGRNLVVSAGNSITNVAASIQASKDLILNADKDVNATTIEDRQYQLHDLGSRLEERRSVTHLASNITSAGALKIGSGRDVLLKASNINSSGALSIEAGNNVSINTAQGENYSRYQDYRYTQINQSKKHQGSSISGREVSIGAGNNITLRDSNISASNTVGVLAKGDVNILAVNDSQYHYDKTVSKKSFGRSKTTINETYQEQVKGSAITAGNDISIKAQNLDSVVTAGGDSDINIIGSALNADNEVTLSADGDVKLAAQTYKQFERHETIKKGFGGLSGRNQGSLDDATLLNSSYLINSGNTSITAGRDIGVIASEVTSGGEVNLNAVDDVLIAAGDVLKKSQQWDEKMSFLSGGNLFEMEKKRQGEETSTAQSSSIHSGDSLTVNAGSVKVVGSELNADHNVSLTADTGDVEILAAKETTKTFKSEEKLAISFDTVTKVLVGDVQDLVKVEDGTVKISLGEATYDKEKQKSDALNHKGSNISAKNDVSIDAESSILVEGSSLTADSDSNEQGDISLSAKDDVTIKESVDTLSEQSKEVHGKAEASVIVQHQAVEVAKAAVALKKSTKKLKQAKADYKQYKKGLDSLQSTLATLEQEYTDRKPGVLFEDVEELRDLISEVKSDEAWYVAGVALATQDVVSKTTLLVQQTAAAVQSTGTYGFNAGIHLDVEASKTTASSQQTTSQGSQLSGQNILVRAGQQEGNKANISGSALKANDNLEIAANEVNITSSQDTHNSKSETQSGKIGASMTVYGASSGINLNASYDRNQSTSSSITHNNSQLNADNITITSTQDTNIKGATVAANESLTVDVGGNLNVASVQDRHSSSQKGMGISGGLSLSGGQTADGNGALPEGTLNSLKGAGNLTGASGGFNTSNGRTRTKQTVLTSLNSGGSADITVANNTDVKGALIATTDENGQDSEKLNLTTGTLTYADLSNTSYNQNRSMGLNTSVGVNDGELDSTNNSTSVQYKNTSGYSKSKTLATIGQGNLTIVDSENSDDTSRLNRDTEHTEKDLFTVDRKQGDIDVTVDHRLLTEDGREAIAKDVETTHEAGQDVYRAAETYVKSDEMDLFDFGKSVSDNRKVTELKNDLLSSQEGLDLLKDLKSIDPDKVLAAQAEISKKAQEKYGLEPEQVNFYDADKTTSIAMQDNDVRDVHGGVVTDDDHEMHGEVNVDVSGATTKTELLNTLGHETYESITENTTGEQTAAQEDLAKSFGNQLEDRVNQAAGGDLDSTVGDNWNSSLVNSSTTRLNTERVNKVGNANVDYYLTPKQQESKQQELSGCGNDNRCQIDVVRKYGAIDSGQEFERDSAKYGQLAENIKDGVTNVVDAVSSPIDTVSGWIDSLKGVTPESVAEAVNAGADNQHQTLVDRDQAFINGDSEKLGKAEGDIATEYLSTQSVPGGAGVVGKIIDKLDGKSTVIPNDTSSVRSQVLENIEKNKAAKPTDNFKVYASKEKARQFYLDQGWEGKWIDSHLEGIDFTKPVSVETLKSGEQVYQWQVPNAQQGNYYTPDKVTQPDELGINPQAIHRGTGELVDKVQSPYKVNKDVKVLQSTAREIEDTWSVPDEPYNTSGGGTQLFTSDKASLEKLEE
ncbi:hemagglutinin repeat-containing protein [Vibrio brasiliensis]|uniref:two-partner secretion domain-containing protein n=1 Tax=Vibrio brasiliensis TaxID=170652 RepID=UPI001EFCD96E|nr:hemagglutinin repeat-containing protein [Vibrio brasiliensis]MCG9647893.1 hemagglutinin repeat-containing protein [Vibrio brasiliensis]